jgi:hypothetical protein
MKRYACIADNKVVEIINGMADEEGNEIPIEHRFHPDFVAQLVDVTGVADVVPGWDYGQGTFSPPAPIGPTVPQSVSPLQARKALRQQGLLATVQGAVAAADADTQDAWEYATSFDRNSPFVLGMAQVLGWTDAQLNDLFVLAATL